MKVIEPLTPEDYQHYYHLRWKVLRAPWNQPRGSEQDDMEKSSHHLMVVDNNHDVIAVGRLHFNSIREAQFRYMAVDTRQQRRGAGTLLLRVMERKAIELGADCIVLDAREHALRFYHKHGYQAEGPGQTLFNSIPHVKMRKNIIP
ncbi:GNAT family N-acetyltransferase [Gammaproteobacteria bacterium]|nr:GNAT family N-acetyltransferase [Gammaproteobacteria bacterium]